MTPTPDTRTVRERILERCDPCSTTCEICMEKVHYAEFGFELACEMLEDHCPDVVQSTKNMAAWLREKLK